MVSFYCKIDVFDRDALFFREGLYCIFKYRPSPISRITLFMLALYKSENGDTL